MRELRSFVATLLPLFYELPSWSILRRQPNPCVRLVMIGGMAAAILQMGRERPDFVLSVPAGRRFNPSFHEHGGLLAEYR